NWSYLVQGNNALGQTTQSKQEVILSGMWGIKSRINETTGYTPLGLLSAQESVLHINQSIPDVTLRHTGYNFQPATGNLQYRQDFINQLYEHFTFDNLNRLTQAEGIDIPTFNPLYPNLNIAYSSNGNITAKTDAGAFEYDVANRVSQIADPVDIPADLQTLEYTPFDKVELIEEDIHKAQFTYWPDKERAIMELYENGSPVKTRYYAPGYEKE